MEQSRYQCALEHFILGMPLDDISRETGLDTTQIQESIRGYPLPGNYSNYDHHIDKDNTDQVPQPRNIKGKHQMMPPSENTNQEVGKIDRLPSPQLTPKSEGFLIKTISSDDKDGIYEYDGIQLKKVTDFPASFDRWPACVMLEDGSLFFCGGLFRDCDSILTPKNQIREIPEMNITRCFSAIVKVEQRIYVFGGLNWYIDSKKQYVSEASYFDLQQYLWIDIKSLPNNRSGCGAAYYNGFIYVGGGNCNDDFKHNEILKYDIQRDEYFPTIMTFSNAKTHNCNGSSLFVVQNCLYCLKGIGMRVYNLDSEEHLNTFPIPDFSWWSNFPPVVIGDEVYLGNTRDEKFRKVNLRTRLVTEIGNLDE